MNKIILPLAGVLLLALTLPALADSVSVPWGNWLDAIIEQVVLPLLAALILAGLGWSATLLPPSLKAYVNAQNTQAVEQLLEHAIRFGLNKVDGAAAGQYLDVTVGSSVLAEALQYAVDHGPEKLVAWAGGVDALREKILARLPLAPGADGGQVLAAAK